MVCLDQRVIKNAEYILQEEQAANPHQTFDSGLVRLGALMHDVGDKKYASPGKLTEHVPCLTLF